MEPNWIRVVPILGIAYQAFFVLCAILCIVLKLRLGPRSLGIFFPHHNLRWIFSVILIVVEVFDLLCQTLRHFFHGCDDVFSIADPVWSSILVLISTVTSIVFYDCIESSQKSRFLVCLLLHWACSCLYQSLQLCVLIHVHNFSYSSIQLLLHLTQLNICVILLAIDVLVLLKTKYRKVYSTKKRNSKDASTETDSKYSHQQSNFPSKITWNWLNPILKHGYHKSLDFKDLTCLPQKEKCTVNFRKFLDVYHEEKKKAESNGVCVSLWKCYWRCHWRVLVLAGIYKFIADQSIYVGPMLIEHVIDFVIVMESYNGTAVECNQTVVSEMSIGAYFSNGYVIALMMLLAVILQATLMQNSIYLSLREGIRCKGALQALVYDKALRLSEGDFTQGKVLNHMSVDPINVFMMFQYINFIWSLPLQIMTGFILLYLQLGLSAFISGLLIILLTPVQYLIGRTLAQTQQAIMQQSDERLKKSSELLHSIKLLKLYAWEKLFCSSILQTRHRELQLLLRAAMLRILSIVITDGTPIITCMMTFLLYPYLENKPLEAGKVFSSMALFNVLAIPLFVITNVINITGHGYVSTSRLSSFVQKNEVQTSSLDKSLEVPILDSLPEKEPLLHSQSGQNGFSNLKQPTQAAPLVKDPATTVCKMEAGDFSWGSASKGIVLHGIELHVNQGLYMVVGAVGSGKSSLLSALLGEMVTVSGTVTWNRNVSIANVSQRPWLLNASLRDNILFGRPLDTDWYQRVINMCALQPDIDILVAGDDTEIGERGVNLSGGQKQRISIARAIYSQAQVYIMDDPLSALDAPVARHIFTEAIQSYLAENSNAVIITTHQLQYLSHATWAVLIEGGKITHQGEPAEVIPFTSGLDKDDDAQQVVGVTISEVVVDACSTSDIQLSVSKKFSKSNDAILSEDRMLGLGVPSLTGVRGAVSLTSLTCPSLYDDEDWHIKPHGKASHKDASASSPQGQLIEEEERHRGTVPMKVYLRYIHAATWILTIVAVSGYVIRQLLKMAQDYWLALWMEAIISAEHKNLLSQSNQSASNGTEIISPDDYDLHYWLNSYIAFSLVSVALIAVGIFFLELMALNAAKNLHQRMLYNVIAAPMRFFDTTPLGRIINRMAGDTKIIDQNMPVSSDMLLFCSLYVIAGIIMNAVFSPFFILPAIPISICYIAIQRFYIASSREMQRLDSITKSPILSHFSETLDGLSTIRAYRGQDRFQKQNWKRVDDNNLAFLFLNTAHVWMGIRLDYLGAFIVCAATISSLTSGIYGLISPTVVGLVVAYAVMISTFLTHVMRSLSEYEMWFNSVERVSFYTDIPIEDTTDNIESVPKAWPNAGKIVFESVSLRYDSELDPVVSDFSVIVQSGEKVGVCGRTGSGKSSLTLGLFRLLDICSGQIIIDGLDICSVPLYRLRAALSIIPQDPALFSGSVRFNLDPDSSKTDEEIWTALDISQLKNVILNLPSQLEHLVTESGENFSLGQRQLFCLARAFLRNSIILVMDEATASIDLETDNTIQKVIKTAFHDKTVITIAHRLSTIMACDTILVLDKGRLVESDTPSSLIKTDSLFAAMVRQNQL